MGTTSAIAISRLTRDELKAYGHEGQTYDELIRKLLEKRRENKERSRSRDSPDGEVGSLQSSESRNSAELVNPASQYTTPTQVNKNSCDGRGCDREATTEIEVNAGEFGVINLTFVKIADSSSSSLLL